MLAHKEFLKMRQAHEEQKIRNKKLATEVKTKIDEQLKKITQQKIAQKKAPTDLEKQKQIDTIIKTERLLKKSLKKYKRDLFLEEQEVKQSKIEKNSKN